MFRLKIFGVEISKADFWTTSSVAAWLNFRSLLWIMLRLGLGFFSIHLLDARHPAPHLWVQCPSSTSYGINWGSHRHKNVGLSLQGWIVDKNIVSHKGTELVESNGLVYEQNQDEHLVELCWQLVLRWEEGVYLCYTIVITLGPFY